MSLDRELGNPPEDSSTSLLAIELDVERIESVYGESDTSGNFQVSDDIEKFLERGVQIGRHDVSELTSMYLELSESLLEIGSLLHDAREDTKLADRGVQIKLEGLGDELEFWVGHTMVVLDYELIFYTHPEERLVYSTLPEREWLELLSKSVLQKYIG